MNNYHNYQGEKTLQAILVVYYTTIETINIFQLNKQIKISTVEIVSAHDFK